MLKKIFGRLMLIGLTSGAFVTQVYCQSKDIPAEFYNASAIPDSLKKDANAVVRYSLQDIVVKGPGKVIKKYHEIVTVLNEKAEGEAEMELFYDKFNSIGAAEMLIYDAAGKLIKKYRKGDLYDRVAYDGYSLITDDRIMSARHTIANYPVTVEKIVEYDLNSCFDFGHWQFQEPEIAVQNTICRLLVSPSAGFRYKNCNTAITPQKTVQNNMDLYTWEVKNLKAVKPEEGALEWRIFPKILCAANDFEIGGIPGNISTWQGMGKWQLALNTDVCSLTPAREAEIRQMTDSIKTDKQKVKFLYQYLQKNTRYVSIQLGIGGLKPLPAMFVDQKKYGDCKALSNYMTALLKAVNIPAYYAEVRAEKNEEPADANFPYDTFNHIIVCVPLKGDTTWLECTNTRKPFGKLGTFTENRNALLVTPDGGKLVNTPRSSIADNQFNSEVHLTLQEDGGAKAQLKISATGGYRDMYLGITDEQTDKQKELFIRNLGIKQPLVFDLLPGDDKEGTKEVNINLEYDRFCDVNAGGKFFYRPRLFDIWRITLPPVEKRKSDYYFDYPMHKTCVTTIDLPQGYEPESIPVNTSLKFTYGNFDISYAYDAAKNQVISTAKFNLTNYMIPAAKYNEMQQYMDDIAKVQNKKLIIKKKA